MKSCSNIYTHKHTHQKHRRKLRVSCSFCDSTLHDSEIWKRSRVATHMPRTQYAYAATSRIVPHASHPTMTMTMTRNAMQPPAATRLPRMLVPPQIQKTTTKLTTTTLTLTASALSARTTLMPRRTQTTTTFHSLSTRSLSLLSLHTHKVTHKVTHTHTRSRAHSVHSRSDNDGKVPPPFNSFLRLSSHARVKSRRRVNVVCLARSESALPSERRRRAWLGWRALNHY